LLAMWMLCPMMLAIGRVLSSPSQPRQVDLLLFLLFPATVLWTYKQTSSYTPDTIIFLLGVLVGWQLFQMLGEAKSSDGVRPWRFAFITLLSAAGVTVKMSFAPWAVASSVIGGILMLRSSNVAFNRTMRLRWAALGIALAVGTGALWMGRGVVLSGYPVYPKPLFGMDVSWKVPGERVQYLDDTIAAWSRQSHTPPEIVLSNWDWFFPWLLSKAKDVLNVILPSLSGIFGIYLLRKRWREAGSLLWILLPPALTLTAVLVSAPDLRFAGASIWILGAGLLTLGLTHGEMEASQRKQRTKLALRFAAIMLAIVVVKASRYVCLFGPEPGFRQTPVVKMTQTTTTRGLTVNTPSTGDQSWNAPLPASPYVNPRLSLRGKDLGDGFMLK
jgi:hypothetical protein